MVRANQKYRLFLLILFILTILFLTVAIMALQTFSAPAPANAAQTLKTGASNSNQIVKDIDTDFQNLLIQEVDLRQFNRALHAVSLQRASQNEADKPIPYFLEEEGQNSIIYFHGEVHIRCWLGLSNDKVLNEGCQ